MYSLIDRPGVNPALYISVPTLPAGQSQLVIGFIYNVSSLFVCVSRENYLFVCSCLKCASQLDELDVTSEDEDDEEGGETEGDEMEDEMTDV